MVDLKRVFVKGGIISPSELKHVINYAESLGLDALHFGSRQDIIFPVHEKNEVVEHQYAKLSTGMISDIHYQNIVSSYVSSDIFGSTTWLNGATYLYLMESFKYHPQLKVNIVDPEQQLVPLFSGQLNFIASPHEDYWYLHINLLHWKASAYYPVLIYSWDIAKISKTIEEIYLDTEDVDELFVLINALLETNSRTIESNLNIPFTPFPYYEGMNKMGINQYWLGLYWRNNKYYLDFLSSFCDFCLDNRIGKICITPWKSFIVKGIPKASKLALEKLLGKAGINIRHSLLELNWHLPVNDDEALLLKTDIVKSFNQNDISTYGLTFAISQSSGSHSYFTSIVIEKNVELSIKGGFKTRNTYNVLHSENFDPNNQSYIVYAQDVDKLELPDLLMELSKLYFEQFGNENLDDGKNKTSEDVSEEVDVFQCKDCLTVYSVHGNELANQANISFENLPPEYTCDVCDAPKSSFVKVKI